MKKILLTLLSLVSIFNYAFAASTPDNRDYKKQAQEMSMLKGDVCLNAFNNFKKDSFFSMAITTSCQHADDDMNKFKSQLYPLSNNHYEGYLEIQKQISSEFIIKSYKSFLEELRYVIDEYCKYNSYKLKAKAPEACLPETINGIFGKTVSEAGKNQNAKRSRNSKRK